MINCNTPPEILQPDLLMPKLRRVLLLASYCGNNNDCSNHQPCNECLSMCNVAEVMVSLDNVIGQFSLT